MPRAIVTNELFNPRLAPAGVNGFTGAGGATPTRINTDGVSALTSVEFSGSDPVGVIIDNSGLGGSRGSHIPVETGQLVYTRCQMKATVPGAGVALVLYLKWLDSTGTPLYTMTLRTQWAIDCTDWTLFEGFAAAPAGAVWVQVEAWANFAPGVARTARVTDCMIVVDPPDPVAGYGDATFHTDPSLDHEGWIFLGAQNASRSRGPVDYTLSKPHGHNGPVPINLHLDPVTNAGSVDYQENVDMMVACGDTSVRFSSGFGGPAGVTGLGLEPVEGQRHLDFLDEYWRAFRGTAMAGQYVATIGGGSTWMNTSGAAFSPDPAHFPDYIDLLLAALAHYETFGIEYLAFEVINEPNNSTWNDDPVAIQQYYDLIAALYDALKPVYPDVPVVTGGLAPGFDRGQPGSHYNFLDTFYDCGPVKWDGVGLHPYPTGANSGTPPTGHVATGGSDSNRGSWEEMFWELNALLDAKGDSGRDFWLTEVGLWDDDSDTDPPMTKDLQMKGIRQFILLAEHNPQIRCLHWHTPCAKTSTADGFGWHDQITHEPKPVVAAVRAMHDAVPESEDAPRQSVSYPLYPSPDLYPSPLLFPSRDYEVPVQEQTATATLEGPDGGTITVEQTRSRRISLEGENG